MATAAVMSHDPGKTQKQRNRLDELRGKPSQAKPKHTLFGSVLEIQDDQSIKELQNIDVKAWEQQQQRKKREKSIVIPEEGEVTIKQKLNKSTQLDQNSQLLKKDEFETQKTRTQRLKESLNDHKLLALKFDKHVRSDVRSPFAQTKARPHQWIKETDLEHAEEINKVGLDTGKRFHNYDRDKAGKSAPAHKYALIGDVLQKDQDFNDRDLFSSHYTPRELGKPKHNTAERLGLPSPRQYKKSSDPNELPPNIKHLFGSKICDSVLQDKALVKKTLEEHKQNQCEMLRARSSVPIGSIPNSPGVNPAYEALGAAVRANIFPGYTFGHKVSHAKMNYTDDVFKRRYAIPNEYRMVKDDYGKWAECNVVRDKVFKAYDAYRAEILAKKKQGD